MRGRLTSLLLSWPLLLSLATLVANDLYLKYAFPGLLTGKLSDFAGIFLVSYLAFGLWPRRRLVTSATIVVLFIVWKSPLSQPLIDAINALAPVRFARVVDYWDLLAFSMMPLALLAIPNIHKRSPSRRQTIASVPIALVAMFAVTASSVYMPTRAFRIQNPDAEKDLDPERLAARIERIAGDYDATCSPEALEIPNLFCVGDDLHILYLFDESTGTAQFQVTIYRGASFILPEPDRHLLEDVLRTLKADFYRLDPEVEYVEAPEPNSYMQVKEFIERICGEDSYCEKE